MDVRAPTTLWLRQMVQYITVVDHLLGAEVVDMNLHVTQVTIRKE